MMEKTAVKKNRLKDVLGGVLLGIIACMILIACGSTDQSSAGNTGPISNNGNNANNSQLQTQVPANNNNAGQFGGNNSQPASGGAVPVVQAGQINPSGNLNVDIRNVIRAVKPSVVMIVAQISSGSNFGGVFGGSNGGQTEQGVGTGSFITPDGYILTNNHVVEGATTLTVVLTDGRRYQGRLIGREGRTNDMAIVKIDPKGGETFPAVALGDSSKLEVGEEVVAIGNALALPGGPSATAGIVSAIGRSIQEPKGAQLSDLLQTDAAINPGNSGGPLLNLRGEIVGMNTAAAVDPSSGAAANSIGFAISINQLRPLIDAYVKGGPNASQQIAQGRPFMGILPQAMTAGLAARYGLPTDTGILVARVDPNTPAQQAGWQQGDIITNMDGVDVKTLNDLSAVLSRHKAGDRVNVTLVNRTGQSRQSSITFGSSPNS